MGSTSTVNASALSTLPQATGSIMGGSLGDIIQYARPERQEFSPSEISDLMGRQARIAEYSSRAAERELSPETAALRGLMERENARQYAAAMRGEVPVSLKNLWVTTGLQNLAGGGFDPSGSFGKNALANLLGRQALQYQDAMRTGATQYLAGKAAPEAALSASDAASGTLQAQRENVAAANAWKQQLANLQMQANANLINSMNTSTSGAMNAMIANQQARSGQQGALTGLLGSLGGAAIGGVLGGPVGAGIGSALGTRTARAIR